MHCITTTPAAIVVVTGVAIGATLLTAYRVTRAIQPNPQQLTDARRAGYELALTHVSRGLLTAAPEEP
ncbi:hypothetical protein ACG93S_28985 [Streptomyces sp. WAC01490]|uniref:hypothetical protein n=1 Tax=unclassified Streptomyces TaxID=2593676 RepID=UPI003F2A964B